MNQYGFRQPFLRSAYWQANLNAAGRQVGFFGVDTSDTQIAFVIDISGSMTGPKLRKAKAELKRALASCGRRHLVNIICFSNTLQLWRDELTPLNGSNRIDALLYVDRVKTVSLTNIYDGLLQALRESRTKSDCIL